MPSLSIFWKKNIFQREQEVPRGESLGEGAIAPCSRPPFLLHDAAAFFYHHRRHRHKLVTTFDTVFYQLFKKNRSHFYRVSFTLSRDRFFARVISFYRAHV